MQISSQFPIIPIASPRQQSSLIAVVRDEEAVGSNPPSPFLGTSFTVSFGSFSLYFLVPLSFPFSPSPPSPSLPSSPSPVPPLPSSSLLLLPSSSLRLLPPPLPPPSLLSPPLPPPPLPLPLPPPRPVLRLASSPCTPFPSDSLSALAFTSVAAWGELRRLPRWGGIMAWARGVC